MAKNILFIVPYAPNLVRVRPYNLIRHLSLQGHRVTVLTLWSSEEERETLEQIRPHCHRLLPVQLARWRSVWNCLGAVPSRVPLQAVYCWEPALAELMEKLAQPSGADGFDVVHVEHLRGAHYGLRLKSLRRDGRARLPVVWDSVDSISLLFRQAMTRSKSPFGRLVTRFELGRTERYEGWLLSQFDEVVVTSSNDRRALLALQPGGLAAPSITVIPNGVDLDYFRPAPDVQREPDTLVVSGKMSYHANITMVLSLVEEIMPHVWAQRPEAKVMVVGKDPSREILALTKDPRVKVTGFVKDLPPYLQQAAVAVAPIAYGVGIQNKVLEAMACGTPVVATAQAVSALEAAPGKDVLVAAEPAAFAQAMVSLLEDAGRREAVGQAGRCYVEAHHNWAKAAQRLDGIYQQAMESAGRG